MSGPTGVTDALRLPQRAPDSCCGEREIQVLTLVATGANNREVAKELFISEATVRTHLVRIYAKPGVSDRTAASVRAHERGLL